MSVCATCQQPMRHLHDVTATDTDIPDERTAAFVAAILDRDEHAHGRSWHVYECQNPECGCGCRRYVHVTARAA